METVIGKYTLLTVNEPEMAVCRFTWREESDSNVILEWDWPAETKVKLMLVFTLDGTVQDETPDLSGLLRANRSHTVVSRDLASRCQIKLSETRQRFLICPAYFNEQKNVVVYQPVYTTGWIFKKTLVRVNVLYGKLLFGKYKRARFSVNLSGCEDTFFDSVLVKALRYGIYEDNRRLGIYPLDSGINGGHRLYVKENQYIKFILDAAYTHLISLEEKQEYGKTYFFNTREKRLS